MLDAERNLRDRTVLVSVADRPDPDATWLQFLLVSDDQYIGSIDNIHYEPERAKKAGRVLAVKLATILDYRFEIWEVGEADERGE